MCPKRSAIKIIVTVVSSAVAIGILSAILLGLEKLREQLGLLGVVVIVLGVLVGAIAGQMKDIAFQRAPSFQSDAWANPWTALLRELQMTFRAFRDDRYGPTFLCRLFEWVALAIAAALLSTLF